MQEIIVRLNAKQDELISVMRTRLLGSLPPSATRPIHPKGMKRPRTSCNLPTVTTASIQPSCKSTRTQDYIELMLRLSLRTMFELIFCISFHISSMMSGVVFPFTVLPVDWISDVPYDCFK